MNEPGNDLPNASLPVESEDTMEGLRRQVNLLFSGLVITSFTVTAYLCLEARRASIDLSLVQPRAVEITKLAEQDSASAQSIYVKLADFARTHPDFQKQIFFKYKFNPSNPAAAGKK